MLSKNLAKNKKTVQNDWRKVGRLQIAMRRNCHFFLFILHSNSEKDIEEDGALQ